MMDSLLLEIGTEEIPAGYIAPALEALKANLTKKLTAARIDHGAVRTFATPRRLALEVAELSSAQNPLTEEVTGPPASVGFDADGKPTMAAVKFAEKIGIPVTEITVKETKKGSYLTGMKEEAVAETKTLLETILPEVITATPFPKTMKWASLEVMFARPIQTVLALYGTEVIPFLVGDVKSGREVLGHRFMGDKTPIVIDEPSQYVEKLRAARVIVDIEERKRMIADAVDACAAEAGGKVIPDPELLDVVTNLVEIPFVVTGKFDNDFLEVPREALITAMREHQKYFAVVDESDNLLPCFVVVNNTNAVDMDLVANGHERVLRARLSDAKFFYGVDLKTPVDESIDKLKKVTFQAKLGSVHEKVERIKDLTAYLGDVTCVEPALSKDLFRAATLCKADLVSQMVIEFTKLQGVMGRVYAQKSGESDEVAIAVEEHYRPTYSGGKLPETTCGALLSIADKIDTICGCFCVDLIPTGASDPYALRRQGIGIVQIMQTKGLSFSLTGLIRKSIALYGGRSTEEIREVGAKVYAFIRDRISNILHEEGFDRDVIASVASISVDNVPDVWSRVAALQALKGADDFEPLAVAFKRVVNIIKKTEVAAGGAVDATLFEDASESALLAAFGDVEAKVKEALESGKFEEALKEIASLRAPVDAFFEGVMVMAEDEKVRNNRLALLSQISDLFAVFADFSKISV